MPVNVTSWDGVVGGPIDAPTVISADSQLNFNPDVSAFGRHLNRAPTVGYPDGSSWFILNLHMFPTTRSTQSGDSSILDEMAAGTHNPKYNVMGQRLRQQMLAFGHPLKRLIIAPCAECNGGGPFQIFSSTLAKYRAAMEMAIDQIKAGAGTGLHVLQTLARTPNLGLLANWVPRNIDAIGMVYRPGAELTTQQNVIDYIHGVFDGGYGYNTDLLALANEWDIGIIWPFWNPRSAWGSTAATQLACPVAQHAVAEFYYRCIVWPGLGGRVVADCVGYPEMLDPAAYKGTQTGGSANWSAAVGNFTTLWTGTKSTVPPPVVPPIVVTPPVTPPAGGTTPVLGWPNNKYIPLVSTTHPTSNVVNVSASGDLGQNLMNAYNAASPGTKLLLPNGNYAAPGSGTQFTFARPGIVIEADNNQLVTFQDHAYLNAKVCLVGVKMANSKYIRMTANDARALRCYVRSSNMEFFFVSSSALRCRIDYCEMDGTLIQAGANRVSAVYVDDPSNAATAVSACVIQWCYIHDFADVSVTSSATVRFGDRPENDATMRKNQILDSLFKNVKTSPETICTKDSGNMIARNTNDNARGFVIRHGTANELHSNYYVGDTLGSRVYNNKHLISGNVAENTNAGKNSIRLESGEVSSADWNTGGIGGGGPGLTHPSACNCIVWGNQMQTDCGSGGQVHKALDNRFEGNTPKDPDLGNQDRTTVLATTTRPLTAGALATRILPAQVGPFGTGPT